MRHFVGAAMVRVTGQQIRYLPALAVLAAQAGEERLDVARELPCFPLEASEDVRLIPDSQGVVLLVIEPRYVALMRQLQKAKESGALSTSSSSSTLSGCLVATAIARGEENLATPAAEHDGQAAWRRGDLVRFVGLQKSPELNGTAGKLLHYWPAQARWDVDLAGEDRGVKALRPQNLERLSEDTPHEAFQAWRTLQDAGAGWRLAEVGVVLHLEKLEEVWAKKEVGAEREAACKATFSVWGKRMKIRSVVNAETLSKSGGHLRVKVDDFEDRDEIDKLEVEEARVLDLLKDVLQRPAPSASSSRVSLAKLVAVMPREEVVERLSARRGKEFWELVRFWQAFLQTRALASKIDDIPESAIVDIIKQMPAIEEGGEVKEEDLKKLAPELAKVFRPELSVFDRANIDNALPIQLLIQADSHRERLLILEGALEQERAHLKKGDERSSLDEMLVRADSDEGIWKPFVPGEIKSKL